MGDDASPELMVANGRMTLGDTGRHFLVFAIDIPDEVLRNLGLTLIPDPLENNPNHALLSGLKIGEIATAQALANRARLVYDSASENWDSDSLPLPAPSITITNSPLGSWALKWASSSATVPRRVS